MSAVGYGSSRRTRRDCSTRLLDEVSSSRTARTPASRPFGHPRVDPVTVYRAIRANAFPAVKIRGRYSVPTQAIDKLVRDAVDTLTCIDVADYVLRRRGNETSQ